MNLTQAIERMENNQDSLLQSLNTISYMRQIHPLSINLILIEQGLRICLEFIPKAVDECQKKKVKSLQTLNRLIKDLQELNIN